MNNKDSKDSKDVLETLLELKRQSKEIDEKQALINAKIDNLKQQNCQAGLDWEYIFHNEKLYQFNFQSRYGIEEKELVVLDVIEDAIAFPDLPIGHYFYYDNRDQQLYRKESEILVVAIDDRDRVVSQHEPINCKLWDIGTKEW